VVTTGPVVPAPTVIKTTAVSAVSATWSTSSPTITTEAVVPPSTVSLDYRIGGRAHWSTSPNVMAYRGAGRIHASGSGLIHAQALGRHHYEAGGRLHYVGLGGTDYEPATSQVTYRAAGSISFETGGQVDYSQDNSLQFEAVP